MPVAFINSPADNEVGFGVETTVGEALQAPYEQLLVTGPTFVYPDTEVVAGDTGDRGGETGRRRIAKGGDADMPMMFRHEANRVMEEHAWRVDYSAEFTFTGSSDLDFFLAGTHEDGSTGLQLRAPFGSFTALVTGGLADSVSIYLRSFANADNNQVMLVKKVHTDGSTFDFLDLYNAYGAGTASDPFGAPKTEELLSSGVIRAGEIIKNTQKGVGSSRTLTLLVDRACLVNFSRFRALTGWRANDWNFEIPDEGAVTATVTGNGQIWTPSSLTPQNGETPPDHFVDNIPDRQFMVGGEDLEFLAIVGHPNAANPAPVPILLGDTNVTNLSFSLAGNNNVLSNILGTRGVTVRRGRHGITGELGFYVPDAKTLGDIERLGDPDNHYKASLHVMFIDPDGFRKALTSARVEYAQSGGEGGGDGEESGSLGFGVEAISKTHRASALQQWSVFV